MMNPNFAVHAACRINGRVTNWDKVQFREVPILLGKLILNADITVHDFSTMELRVSKRPFNFGESKDSTFGGIDMSLATQVGDEDMIDGIPGVAYSDLAQLALDPVWTQYREALAHSRDIAIPPGIAAAWDEKYGQSKFARLLKQR